MTPSKVLCTFLLVGLGVVQAKEAMGEAEFTCVATAYVKVPAENELSCHKKTRTVYRTFTKPVESWSKCRSWGKNEVMNTFVHRHKCSQREYGFGRTNYLVSFKPSHLDLAMKDSRGAEIESTQLPENALQEWWEDL